MRWLLAKIALLGGTAWAAIGGATASQSVAFVHAYLQRLGGHIDEVMRTIEGLRDGSFAPAISDPAVRERMIDAFSARLAELNAARDAIVNAADLWKPGALALHMDREIAARTAEAFTPAIPLDLPSAVYGVAGIVIAWTIWEVAGWPVRRRFRRGRWAQTAEY